MNWRKTLKAKPGHRVDLTAITPNHHPGVKDRKEAQERLERNIAKLEELQYLLYAESKHSLLVVFQAMDAGGKDGTIRRVFTAFNPQGCRVTSFKVPTPEEASHDFLWRIHKTTPARGEIAVFNRSHYEDILVPRVHALVPKAVWTQRYKQINDFESLLISQGTTLVKFFLHISRDEQKKRIEARMQDPSRNWKFSESDLRERRYWNDYQSAYEDVLERCSTKEAPWFIIPANHKWYRNLAVSEIMVETMSGMKMSLPRKAIPPGEKVV